MARGRGCRCFFGAGCGSERRSPGSSRARGSPAESFGPIRDPRVRAVIERRHRARRTGPVDRIPKTLYRGLCRLQVFDRLPAKAISFALSQHRHTPRRRFSRPAFPGSEEAGLESNAAASQLRPDQRLAQVEPSSGRMTTAFPSRTDRANRHLVRR